ncbi:MAG: YggT family protein [Gemmatimonadetes bacterium]|nr:YggT family protein [Gemmatimonadota bacterium]MBL0179092.1 YggT family protein [Gemmatimonadota bacterium]
MELMEVAVWVIVGMRWLVGGAFVVGAVVAATHWAVRRQHLTPFGWWPRFVRGWSDPMLRPVEGRVVRAGGNPQSAPLWLLGGIVVGGLLLIQLVQWVLGTILQLGYAAKAGALLPTLVSSLFSLITAALLVRVISSWFAVSPYSWWMRIVRGLTDWILEPLQRILPPMGPMDFSPLVAYFLLRVAQQVVVGAMSR